MNEASTEVADVSLRVEHELRLLRRQYFQLLPLQQLRWPSIELLKLPGNQAWIYSSMFDINQVKHPLPPERYRLRFLRKLVDNLEEAFEDSDNDVGFTSQIMSSITYFHLINLTGC
jgi:hypothetical protein